MQNNIKALNIHWLIDKKPVTDPEAVFFAFPFNLDKFKFKLDLNGISAEPNSDQLQGSSKDWYPVQRYVDVSDKNKGITMCSLDAPLLNLGGITAGKWTGAGDLDPDGPHLYSWAINNHWMVNFKASQEGEIPFRFRFQTHSSSVDVPSAYKFGLDSISPPIVLRDKKRNSEKMEDSFIITDSEKINYTLKPAEDGNGIILRAQNLVNTNVSCNFKFNIDIVKFQLCDLLENVLEDLGNNLNLNFNGHEIKTIRIIL